jgi:5'-methylthioadenosine phosphorylase
MRECRRTSIGVIVGTGVKQFLQEIKSMPAEELTVDTRYGEAHLVCLKWQRENTNDIVEVFILPRHGHLHEVPPHMINYKANITALKRVGVDGIISTAAVGALHDGLNIGDILVPDQLIDWTKQRPLTFFEHASSAPVHVDMTQPFCERLRKLLITASTKARVKAVNGGCYVCTDGPRYETAAEVKALRLLGGDVVGMTVATEAILAREACICYAPLCVVTNYAAGIKSARLSHSEVTEAMKQASGNLSLLISVAVDLYVVEDCACKHSLDEYGVEPPL